MNDRESGSGAPPHDEESEASVLGAVMLADNWMDVLMRLGLRADDFYRPRNRRIFQAMLWLRDNGQPIDTLTVAARLATDGDLEKAGGKDYIETLVTRIPAIGNTKQYAQIVLENALLRNLAHAGHEIQSLVANRGADPLEILAKAQSLVSAVGRDTASSQVTYQPDELGLMMIESFEKPAEVFKTPWPKFNKIIAGGFRRGSLTVLSGYSSHGKSVIVDQIIERAVQDGYKAHLWINEMTPTDRVARICARRGEIPLDHIVQGKLTIEDHKTLQRVLGELPFGITDCAGWTAEEIARDIRAKRPDIAGVDIFQKIAGGQQVYELDEKSRVLNDVPKESQANCHVLLTAHVTKPSQRDGKPAKPNGSNLRGTGSLENDADYVVFVHRDVNDNGRRGNDGWLYATKTRSGGQPGEIKVTFDGPHQKFTEFKAKKGANAIDDTQEFPF